MESAWKLVREHYVALGQPQRRKAIARKVAYHGVTLGALSFTGIPKFKDDFGPAADRGQPRQQHQPVPGTRR